MFWWCWGVLDDDIYISIEGYKRKNAQEGGGFNFNFDPYLKGT